MRVDCAEQIKDRPAGGAALRRNFMRGMGGALCEQAMGKVCCFASVNRRM